MKKTIRLTESELTNLIRRIVKEQNEVNPLKKDIRVLRLSISGKNSKALVKVTGENEPINIPSCNIGNPNCIKHPSSLKDGVYTKDNFTGVVFLTYEKKTYRCMLEKPCQPI